MNKKKILIVGSSGRMGCEIRGLLENDRDLEFSGGVSRKPEGKSIVKKIAEANASKVDAVIDFSLPGATDSVVEWCVQNKKPLVCGTTGISKKTKEIIKKSGKAIPVLWAPNMSIGVAILNHVIAQLPRVEGFEFQLEEFHHIHKKDKPSGTALFLQETLETKLGRPAPPPISIRGGGIFGIHKLHMMGAEETLTFEHNALSRTVFAKGAVMATKWILNQRAGLYTMSDVVGDLK